ncbi:tRNA-splicing endonuclease subunit SEN15 [Candida viswanathii]|uniref:tRNA-splicing endonuclease subunit SEN15 n=1 Tax=Candida viswanathii TaxID=5486 RepID=A0A367Y4C5_9ASCO|nr:tRNA-splicing endonuclease subunit SEN15 [Candida viswanathii]
MPSTTLPFTSTPMDQVRLNLIHYNLWNNVTAHAHGPHAYLSGHPREKLVSTDPDEIRKEWIVPRLLKDEKLSVQEINEWFETIEKDEGARPARLIIGIINDDGTVVYYFIHDGIVKPRQN